MKKRSDRVVLTVPYSPQSHHLVGAERIRLVKPLATLTSIPRGGVVADVALAEALKKKQLSAAALDVFENQPNVHPVLRTLSNALFTPYVGSATRKTRLRIAKLAARNLTGALPGRDSPSAINADADRERRRDS
jgi:glyoxylate/hydroxypyruvate/2-ketogluconate reductase